MVFESEFKTGLKDIGKGNYIKNESILEILESVAGEHSNSVNFGVHDIGRVQKSWILLDWKVRVLKRPLYAEKLRVKTWGRYFQKAYTYRDFELYNSKGELAVIATSKWALIDAQTHSICRLTDEIRALYNPEDKSVFEDILIKQIKAPESFENEIDYKVGRKDIDVNNHMHNTYYLNLAYEVLPDDVYENCSFDEFVIIYKKEVMLGDTVTCKYSFENDKHIVVIENREKGVVNAIIELKDKKN